MANSLRTQNSSGGHHQPTHPASHEPPLAAAATPHPSAPSSPPEPNPTSLAIPARRRKMAHLKVSPRKECGIVCKPYSEYAPNTDAATQLQDLKGFVLQRVGLTQNQCYEMQWTEMTVPDGFGHQHSRGTGNPPCTSHLFLLCDEAEGASKLPSHWRSLTAVLHPKRWQRLNQPLPKFKLLINTWLQKLDTRL